MSSNNFSAFKLIENWPTWPGKWLNIFGAQGSGKTHLAKILEKKIEKTKLIDAKNVNDVTVKDLINFECLIIDSFNNNIDENLLYSILNQSKQLNNSNLLNNSNRCGTFFSKSDLPINNKMCLKGLRGFN